MTTTLPPASVLWLADVRPDLARLHGLPERIVFPSDWDAHADLDKSTIVNKYKNAMQLVTLGLDTTHNLAFLCTQEERATPEAAKARLEFLVCTEQADHLAEALRTRVQNEVHARRVSEEAQKTEHEARLKEASLFRDSRPRRKAATGVVYKETQLAHRSRDDYDSADDDQQNEESDADDDEESDEEEEPGKRQRQPRNGPRKTIRKATRPSEKKHRVFTGSERPWWWTTEATPRMVKTLTPSDLPEPVRTALAPGVAKLCRNKTKRGHMEYDYVGIKYRGDTFLGCDVQVGTLKVDSNVLYLGKYNHSEVGAMVAVAAFADTRLRNKESMFHWLMHLSGPGATDADKWVGEANFVDMWTVEH